MVITNNNPIGLPSYKNRLINKSNEPDKEL